MDRIDPVAEDASSGSAARIDPVVEDASSDTEAAFDEFLAAGLAPWVAARIGVGLPSPPNEDGVALLPPDALDIPRLEGGIFPNVVGGGHGEWFLPEFSLLAEPDPAFSFAASQSGEVSDNGEPFNRATLTLSLAMGLPANLVALARTDTLRQVPDVDLDIALTIPITAPDGSTRVESVPGTPVTGAVGQFAVTFDLTGSVVEAAYVHLTHSGKAGLEIAATYTAYQTVLLSMPDVGFPVHGEVFRGLQFQPFGDGSTGFPPEPVHPMPGVYVFFPVSARFSRTVPIGLNFDTDAYRSRFTITAEDMTRPIIDGNDLNEFAGARSEYRELTTLGDVGASYPSLRRLYFGQVSGTVVAVPAAYGILRTAQGLMAACDSIVDDSPVTISGCRFHFTFTVFPLADPIDLARLRADILGIPEAAGRTLRVALPAGLDSRNPSSLDGFPAAKTSFSDGQGPAVQVGIDISDNQPTPATTTVNQFLQQLGSTGPAPLFGNLAVRLDDVFPQPVRTQLLLNVRQTAGQDDITVTAPGGDPPTADVTNKGPLDLVLHRFGTVRERRVTTTPLGERQLAAGRTTTLPGIEKGASVEVSRDLAAPAPLPRGAMLTFVAFHTQTVQQVQHPLTVNATGLDFAAAGVTAIDIRIAMTASPGTPVPAMTLTPSHPLDFVHVAVPVDSAVTGLDSTVALSLTTTAGPRTVALSHDFVDDPILVITQSTLR